jgi:hypothetical protein
MASYPIDIEKKNGSVLAIFIVGFFLVCIVLALLGAGNALRFAFPVATLLLGMYLHDKSPSNYVGFTLWVWLITPFIRRLIDSRSGWDSQGVILLAPYLVTSITAIDFIKFTPIYFRGFGLPFLISALGVLYGIAIGYLNTSLAAVVRSLIEWLPPILWGFYFVGNWQNFPQNKRVVQQVLIAALLLLSVYGIFQYFYAPEWDTFWLINSELTSSAGKPEPQGFRLWSTVHSPGHFAAFLMVALLFILDTTQINVILILGMSSLAMLLTSVRAAWIAWLIGALVFLLSVHSKIKVRLIVILLILSLAIFTASNVPVFSGSINARLESMQNLSDDNSAKDRMSNYSANIDTAMFNVIGGGVGSTKQLDSGILVLAFTLGWIGSIPYLLGIGLILSKLFSHQSRSVSIFVAKSRAIVAGMLSLSFFFSSMLGFFGVFLWGFLGLGIAAIIYDQKSKDGS